MAIIVAEKNRGTSGNATGWRKVATVQTTAPDDNASEFTIAAAVQSYLGDTLADGYGGSLIMSDLALDFFQRTPAGIVAEYTAQYGPPAEGSKLGDGSGTTPWGGVTAEFDFAYSEPSGTIRYSYATTAHASPTYMPLGAPLWDHRMNVKMTWDGPEYGEVDLPTGNTTHTFKLTVPRGFVSPTYQTTVLGLLGKVNSSTFKGAAAGTVRFVQCSSSKQSNGPCTISWGFKYSENQPSQTVAGISGVSWNGHDYLWALDIKVWNNTKKFVELVTGAVYVEQIFRTADLNGLGF